ncbi:hypothetical protein KM043_003371 [Ampulex compressa]|nr:hypothetical protein KM043_003371 [Ampulex compressa]
MPHMDDDFTLVTRRRRRRKEDTRPRGSALLENSNLSCLEQDNPDLDCETFLRKLSELVLEIRSSSFAVNLLNVLSESLSVLAVAGISEIVCYGLGQFSCRRASKYQLALLVLLKTQYGCPVHVYDPSFLTKEVEVLRGMGFEIIGKNEEGKRIIGDGTTLMYMPHCPTQLTNNFLYANWGKQLSHCVIMANSFSYQEVFNDFNLHFFPLRNLDKVPSDFWKQRNEPSYYKSDVEFNVATMNSTLKTIRRLVNEIRQVSFDKRGKEHILRRCKEIRSRYTGKGERSIKETADLVGFKLPHDPK